MVVRKLLLVFYRIRLIDFWRADSILNSMKIKTFLSNYTWIIPFVAFLGGYLLLDFLLAEPSIETPDIIGKNIAQATKLLSQHNFNIRISAEKEDSELADGTIIAQTPHHKKIKPYNAIFVVVSKKPTTLSASSLIGQSKQSIEKITQPQKLRTMFVTLPNNAWASGYCFAQLPQIGHAIKDHTMTAFLTPTEQEKLVIMPDFKSMKKIAVQEFLTLHDIKYTLHPSELDYITEQRPFAGSIVNMQKVVIELK